MHEGRPSFTAMFVAAARAVASTTRAALCDPGDALALQLLSPAVQAALGALAQTDRHLPALPRALAFVSLGMLDHLALRTRALDAALVAALARGARQVVILGAGLDTRAHRVRELAAATVFEVDHPASQVYKRERAGALPVVAAKLCYVAVDFTRTDLERALDAAGHDERQPTFWLWEGVVPYLEVAAIERTLRAIVRRSAPSSVLAMTYVPRRVSVLLVGRPLVDLAMNALGEPLRTLLAPDEARALLERAGLQLSSDEGTHALRETFGDPRARRPTVAYERVALATL